MQSKYRCSQSQGNAKSCLLTYKINKQRETRFPDTTRKICYSTTSHGQFLLLSHTTQRVTVFFYEFSYIPADGEGGSVSRPA